MVGPSFQKIIITTLHKDNIVGGVTINTMHSPLSSDFVVPTNADVSAIFANDPHAKCCYLSGNSLGLLSNRSKELIKEELDVWASRGVTGHFNHPHNRPWVRYAGVVTPLLAEIVGAEESEVACMGTLTANLHVMMDSFYKPTPERFKILCEARAFPSDQYAFASQTLGRGYDPAQAILAISPREGEAVLREEDILDIIEKEGKSIALVLFSGVQYYTGQHFPIESITKAAVSQGCICGWDLAHAVGNVPLLLHDWGVDFAVWCSYKFLNSGPGGIAGLFMHKKWNSTKHPNHAGWWGHDPTTRFQMPPTFSAIPGAHGFQQSNPCIIALASLLGSLQIFRQVGMKAIHERSLALTGALERSLQQSNHYVPLNKALLEPQTAPGFTIITPTDPMHRGAQLSLLFLPVESGTMQKVFTYLTEHGVVVDERKPDVIRLAPAPLYNTIDDCDTFVHHLNAALGSLVCQ